MNIEENRILYLHVGFHKTASSSIQLELYKRKESLKAHGYHYPHSWRFNHNFLYGMFCDEPQAFYENVMDGISLEEIEDKYNSLKELYKQEVSSSLCKKYVLSAEDLSVLETGGIERLKEFLYDEMEFSEVRIIVCLRSPISFAVSDIQQSIKVGYDFSYDRYDSIYRKRLQGYIDVFGLENISLFKFEDAVKCSKGPIENFLIKIGADESLIKKFEGERINESYSIDSINAMKFINKHSPISDGKSITEGRFSNDTNIFSKHQGEPFFLDEASVKTISCSAKEDTEWLRSTFGIDYSTQLSDLKGKEYVRISSSFLEFVCEHFIDFSDLIKKYLVQYLVVQLEMSKDNQEINDIIDSFLVLTNNHYAQVSLFFFSETYEKLRDNGMAYTADLFREGAFTLEKKGLLHEALRLLLVAKIIRPDGEVINQRIRVLEERIL
ncbi:hypothetical protein [Vibrio atypicus]|uniref:hypothetical protein n=1 Tax=Vibrio atypicus TaxID=558271 RepID=UPI001357D728|nr:hypothetical protein [Vibrio atypicus]